MKKEWELIEIYEDDYIQDNEKSHPFKYNYNGETPSFIEIQVLFQKYSEEHPEYSDFRFEYCEKHHGYGAWTSWYELQGLKRDL